jgi:uncharacterized protein (TIGR03435 family)
MSIRSRLATVILLVAVTRLALAQSMPRPRFEAFEVATVKPVEFDPKGGRYIKMEGPTRFVAKDYTLKLLVAAAYDLNVKAIEGGPAWVADEHFDIVARTPGDLQPTHAEQMTMLRALLVERFGLRFHRAPKEMAMYALTLAKGGAKLQSSTLPADAPVVVGPGVVYPDHILLPGRNATTGDLVSLLQRAILDRPVVDKTGLTGRYDFSLEWAPNEAEFGGDVPSAPDAGKSLPLFAAIQAELGLKLEATRGPVSVFVVDAVARPEA